MDKNEQEIKSYLLRISNILLINGGLLGNPGLYTGDMGIVLFFYLYARFSKCEIFSEYSSYLLDNIQNKVNQSTSVNYIRGLTGIGSTIEYLSQNGCLKDDKIDLLKVFDNQIFFTYNLPYLSIDKLVDIGYYTLWRLSGNSAQKETLIKPVMTQIVNIIEEKLSGKNLTHPAVSFFRDTISSETTKHTINENWLRLCRKNVMDSQERFGKLTNMEEKIRGKNADINLNCLDLGVQNGLTGLGLSLLSEIDGDDSWISLFPNPFNP